MSNNKKLNLTIVTPEKMVFSGDTESIVFPGIEGQFGIWVDHTPLLSILDIGIVDILFNGKKSQVYIEGGFLEIFKNKVSALVNFAFLKNDLDLNVLKNELTLLEKKPDSIEKSLEIKKIKSKILLFND